MKIQKNTGSNTKLYVAARIHLAIGALAYRKTTLKAHVIMGIQIAHPAFQTSKALAEIPDVSRQPSPFKSQQGHTNSI